MQLLIDSFVPFRRHKIPRRNLVNLAQRYHNNVTLQPLMAESSSIALLQPPPSWGLTSNTDSDWVIRARILKEQGTKLNRHQRKNRKKLGNGTDYVNDNESASTSMMSTMYPEKGEKPPLQAVIASGTGPDGRAEARKLRKKRKVLKQSVVVIVFSLVAVTAKNYFVTTPVQNQSPIHKEILVEQEELRSLTDVAVDASEKHDPATAARRSDQTKTAISSEDKVHAETTSAKNQKVESESQGIEEPSSTQNENKDASTKSDSDMHEGSHTAIIVSQNPSGQLARAFGHIKAAVEEEISFECKGSARSAEAAQEIWRKQANKIKTQGGRLLNFSKGCLSKN
jgi:hypothetical protein